MLIFLLSLAGIPPTAGFIGKVLSVCRRYRNGSQRAGRHRRSERRDLDVLLLPNRRGDVHAGADREDRPDVCSRVSASALGVAIIFTMVIGIYPDPFISLAGRPRRYPRLLTCLEVFWTRATELIFGRTLRWGAAERHLRSEGGAVVHSRAARSLWISASAPVISMSLCFLNYGSSLKRLQSNSR